MTAGTEYRSSTGANGAGRGPTEPGADRASRTTADHGTQGDGFVHRRPSITLGRAGRHGEQPGRRRDLANLRQDFGLFRPLTVGDFVWDDREQLRGAGRRRRPGWAGWLGHPAGFEAGEPASSHGQTTDANGGYLFTNLAPGTYIGPHHPAGRVPEQHRGERGGPAGRPSRG